MLEQLLDRIPSRRNASALSLSVKVTRVDFFGMIW